MVGTLDARNEFVAELTQTDGLVELLEGIVRVLFHPLTPMVERLLALIKDKDTLHEELKRIILRNPLEVIWKALDAMYAPP